MSHTHDTCVLLQAVTMFQSYYGLDLTGRLDDMTMSAVHTPRCMQIFFCKLPNIFTGLYRCTVMDLVSQWDGRSQVANFNLRSRWDQGRFTLEGQV